MARGKGNRGPEHKAHNTFYAPAISDQSDCTEGSAESAESEILPAFYPTITSPCFPTRQRTVTIDLPGASRKQTIRVRLSGWNVIRASIAVGPADK